MNLLFTVLFVVFALVNVYYCYLPESPKRKGAKKARRVDGLGLGLGLRHVHGLMNNLVYHEGTMMMTHVRIEFIN